MSRFLIFLMCLSVMSMCKQQESQKAPSTGVEQQVQEELPSKDSHVPPKTTPADIPKVEIPVEGKADTFVRHILVDWSSAPDIESYVHVEWERGDYVAYHICPGDDQTDLEQCQSGRSFRQSVPLRSVQGDQLYVTAWVCTENLEGQDVCGPSQSKVFPIPHASSGAFDRLTREKHDLTQYVHQVGRTLKQQLSKIEQLSKQCPLNAEQKALLDELLTLPSGVLGESFVADFLEQESSALALTRVQGSSRVESQGSRVDGQNSQILSSPSVSNPTESVSKPLRQRWSQVKGWLKHHPKEVTLLLGGLAVTVAVVRLMGQKSPQKSSLGDSQVSASTSSACHGTENALRQLEPTMVILQNAAKNLQQVQNQLENP